MMYLIFTTSFATLYKVRNYKSLASNKYLVQDGFVYALKAYYYFACTNFSNFENWDFGVTNFSIIFKFDIF